MLQKIDRTIHISGRPLVVREEIAQHHESRACPPDSDGQPQGQRERPEIALDDLVFFVAAVFRGHPHINNVLTHISGASWRRGEQSTQGFSRRPLAPSRLP
jgi:hypothetical protein